LSGIYIHIPFCKQKCHYCNFFSLVSEKHRREIVPALIREMEFQKGYLNGESINTIYFGGGTPSLLSGSEITRLIETIHSLFNVRPDAEITLEANPDDLVKEKLTLLKASGINRLSIGIQSFEDADLQFLNRTHSAKQAYNSIQRSQDAGFSNLSIDLIYGIPTLDSAAWESNLMIALELGIPHISSYALTVEEKTPLAVLIRNGKLPDVDDAIQAQHFEILVSLLQAYGYLHYEISNFCKPGMFARHNTSYWNGIPYLGIGPSAHSFNGSSRQWNVSNLGLYIQSIQKDQLQFEKEVLSPAQHFNEYVMTSLRTQWGCNLDFIENKFGRDWVVQARKDIEKYIRSGMVRTESNHLFLTSEGKFMADGIAAELFRVV
jgi:oxygen-independent coproporphyrinogen-3 oxidase